MHDSSEATTATHFRARTPQRADGFRLVARAPGPETPDSRNRTGARKGMFIVLAGSVGFWSVVAVAALHLIR